MPTPTDDISVLRHVSNNAATYGLLIGLAANFGVGVWFAATLEARVGAVERQQTTFSITLDRLNDSREKTDIHLTQVDDKLANMDGKISAILDIVQRMEDSGGGPKGRASSFGAPR